VKQQANKNRTVDVIRTVQSLKKALTTTIQDKLNNDDLDPEFALAQAVAYLNAMRLINAAFTKIPNCPLVKKLDGEILKTLEGRWLTQEAESERKTYHE